MADRGLCWIRRDIRWDDNTALAECTRQCREVLVVFVFDPNILEPLKKKSLRDKRVQFIAESLIDLDARLQTLGSQLLVRFGDPVEVIPSLVTELAIDHLFFSRDTIPYARTRDSAVIQAMTDLGRRVSTVNDSYITDPDGIVNAQNQAFRVFTPYSREWKRQLELNGIAPAISPDPSPLIRLSDSPPHTVGSLMEIAGFEPQSIILPGGEMAGRQRLIDFAKRVDNYDSTRDFLTDDSTSMLSVYLRHGAVSIRDCVRLAQSDTSRGRQKWLDEIIWREFYTMIFYHYPHTKTQPFQEKFSSLEFPTDEVLLASFKDGTTGFPIIDASMRCLNNTGWMPNRLRMVTASFLTKILLVDWRRGERYFSWKLLDYDLASNVGGWQWSAGVGADAAPYFRIFNPVTQSRTYDPNGKFIRTWVPELAHLNADDIHWPLDARSAPHSFVLGRNYPVPIVDYSSQRAKAIELFRNC